MFPKALFTANPYTRGTQIYASTPPAWSPADLSNLNLWLDANDLTTLFQLINGTTAVTTNGDLVGYWADKSPAGNHAAALADNATRFALVTNALNSKPVVRSATGDVMNNSTLGWTNTAYTKVMVYKQVGWVANGGIFSIKPNSGQDWNSNGGLSIAHSAPNTTTNVITIASSSATSLGTNGGANYRILSITFAGASRITAWSNGVVVLANYAYNIPYSAANGYLLNGRFLSSAIDAGFRPSNDYAEIIHVARVVTTAEHNQIGEYLAAKWGLSWTTVT